MINSVSLTGRLTKEVELRYTPSGVPMARFTLAVNRTFKQEGQQEADFIQCIAWRKQAENLANYMKKGSLVGVTGRIQTGSFEGQDGKRVFTTDIVAENIVFLESRGENGQSQQTNQSQSYQQPSQQQQPQYQQQSQQTYQPPQQNYNRVDEDPFKNNGRQLIVDEDSLPF